MGRQWRERKRIKEETDIGMMEQKIRMRGRQRIQVRMGGGKRQQLK